MTNKHDEKTHRSASQSSGRPLKSGRPADGRSRKKQSEAGVKRPLNVSREQEDRVRRAVRKKISQQKQNEKRRNQKKQDLQEQGRGQRRKQKPGGRSPGPGLQRRSTKPLEASGRRERPQSEASNLGFSTPLENRTLLNHQQSSTKAESIRSGQRYAVNAGRKSQKTRESALGASSGSTAKKQKFRRVRTARRSRRTLSSRGKISIAIFILLVVSLLFWLLPIFRISQIHLQGYGWLQASEIEAKLQDALGHHGLYGVSGGIGQIFTARYGKKEAELLQEYPSLEACKVQFRPPGKLRVDMELKEPRFLAAVDGDLYEVDEGGRLARKLEAEDAAVAAGTPAVTEPAADEPDTEFGKSADKHYIHLYPRRNRTADRSWAGDFRVGELLDPDLPLALEQFRRLEVLLAKSDEEAADGLILTQNVEAIRPADKSVELSFDLTGEPGISDAAAAVIRDVGICLKVAEKNIEGDLIWLRFAIKGGALNDLGSGQLKLTPGQRYFVPDRLLPADFNSDKEARQQAGRAGRQIKESVEKQPKASVEGMEFEMEKLTETEFEAEQSTMTEETAAVATVSEPARDRD